MKRAFIACGGTGGHLSPGIALAEELVGRGWDCRLLISNKQVDSRLVKKYQNFKYETLSGSALSLNPVKFVRFFVNLAKGTISCYKRIKSENPDLVIGFGGFLSMPALLAGLFSGLPTAIHEANQVAGRVTRLSSIFVKRIYLPTGVSVRTTRTSRIRFVGMPVRREIRSIPKYHAKRALEFDRNKKLLVVMGGSQGASSLNQWVKDNLDSLAQREIQVLCLTGGTGHADSTFTFKSPAGQEVKSIFRKFSDDMASIFSAADLVISRSGAGSIAELIRCRTPAVLIPYPFSADDHQVKNAEKFEKLGCGLAMSQECLGSLLDEVRDLIYNEWLMQKFRINLENADRASPQVFMANDLDRILLLHKSVKPELVRRGA